MVKVCEHSFEAEDPAHPGYSMTEVDLFRAVGGRGESYSMRHNKTDDVYEIFNYLDLEPYTDEAVARKIDFDIFPPVDELLRDEDLHTVIDYANRLEEAATGSSSFEYGHQPRLRDSCPDDTLQF